MAKLFTIKKRKEFIRVASKGFKMVTSTIILQAAPIFCAETKPTHIGLTATKKLGKAHDRNLTKRRIRAVIRELSGSFLPNTSYVLIGRHNTASCDFIQLQKDLKWGLKKINTLLECKENEKPHNSNSNPAG